MKQLAFSFLLALSPLTAFAQTVLPCDWQAQAAGLVEPWEDNSRTYSNGAIRIALLDIGEPIDQSMFLLILAPPYDELGDRQCGVIGFESGLGFHQIKFAEIDAVYDPVSGLAINMPVDVYYPETGNTLPYHLFANINQADGDLGVYTVPMYD